MNWLKTPFFEPFREIFYVIYHNIYGADGKLHGITVEVILGRCFGNMHLGFAPHMDITFPDRALREKHTCGEDGVEVRVPGKQVVGNIVNLIDFTTGVCNLCFKKHLRLMVIGKACANLVGCSRRVVEVAHIEEWCFTGQRHIRIEFSTCRLGSAVHGLIRILRYHPCATEFDCPLDRAKRTQVLYLTLRYTPPFRGFGYGHIIIF